MRSSNAGVARPVRTLPNSWRVDSTDLLIRSLASASSSSIRSESVISHLTSYRRCDRHTISAADREPGEAADDDVLARLRREGGAQLIDRLALVLVLVDVLLAQQDDLVEPLVELALHDALAHILRPFRRLF